jgi:predicted ribosome-associated RNA-binding protein Tma20
MAVHETLMKSDNLPEKGRITKTIHHLQDDLWKFSSP